jgi:hypothetical protein
VDACFHFVKARRACANAEEEEEEEAETECADSEDYSFTHVYSYENYKSNGWRWGFPAAATCEVRCLITMICNANFSFQQCVNKFIGTKQNVNYLKYWLWKKMSK